MMVEGILIDYARPCMMAEKALKNAHDAMLDRDYDVALGESLAAIAEAKMMYNSIKHQMEVDRGLC
jgi:hypothetical protein